MAKKSPSKKSYWKFWLCLLVLVAGFVVCAVYAIWASTFDLKQVNNIPERSSVFDMDGKYYSRLEGENRVTVPLERVSQSLQKALLAREDSRFYRHHGIDPIGISRALVRNILHGHIREGGSTLTQQLALNTFLGGHHTRSLNRKLLEAFLSLRIEQNFTKRQILESYMNRIYFGAGVYGIETASQTYFGKPASKLTLNESAMLVALIRSPHRYSPFQHLKVALHQRDLVLDRMVELKMIDSAQSNAARRTPLALAKKHATTQQENYALDAVRRDLDMLLDDDQHDEGGLKIYTTIDPALQRAAQIAVDADLRKVEQKPGYDHTRRSYVPAQGNETETAYLQGALVAIDNRTGGIRALVGGRDYAESRFNRALLSKRQVGSTFKPFVYATAFTRGLRPDSLIDDSRIHPGELSTISNWSPENSDGVYGPPKPAAEGLIQSRNTMSVRIGNYAGLDNVIQTAERVGLGKIPSTPAVFIGAFEATLRDMTAAYTVFPNDGQRRQPYVVERIDDPDGQVIYRASHVNAPAIDPGSSALVTSLLQQVLTRGTAASARSLGWHKAAAGKTGTTNDYKDAWFVGYTKSLTCGVWVGFDRPQTIMSRGYGATLALPIWIDAMNAASPQKYPAPQMEGDWQSGSQHGPEHGIESLPGNIFRSFRRFFGGH